MYSPAYRETRQAWWSAGANGPGEANGQHILTDDLVRKIRSAYIRGKTKQKDLAVQFGVGQSTISRVIRGESWGHILSDNE